MKIVIVSPSLSTNRNVSGISSVVQFIINNNIEHQYYHFELGKRDDEIRNLLWFFRIFKVYSKWFRNMIFFNADIIHFNFSISRLAIFRDAPLIFLSRLFNRRMILHIHGGELFQTKNNSFFIHLILKRILNGKNAMIVLSTTEKEVLKKKYNCENIKVLPNCIELGDAKKFNRSYEKHERLVLLFFGRITINKGIEYIYNAMESLKLKGSQFKFVMAGAGPEEKLYVEKFTNLLGNDFEFMGVVSGNEKISLLKTCDLFLLPSFFEGLPMALLESMSFGIVPITTNEGSMSHVVKNENNGIIVSKYSTNDIVFAVEKLISNREYLKILSTNARQYIFDHNIPEKYFSVLNDIYKYQ
jgi:glycosyltransferase involved in cell wall biosynthesis